MNGTINHHSFKILGLLLLLSTAGCDSGDIYSSGGDAPSGIAVNGTFELLNPEVFPQEYDMVFGVFSAEASSALSSVNVLKPAGGKMQLSIDDIPDEAELVRLCLINSGRQVIYTFFEYELDRNRISDIDLPTAQIDLLEYDRIQRLVFQQYNCTSCHQGTAGASNLLLTEQNSYKALVNIPSVHSGKPRVEPGHPENSFLIDVLTEADAVGYPHTGLVTRSEDLGLLRIWIEKGCPQN